MTRAEWNQRKGRSSSFVSKSTRMAIYARDKFDCVYCRQVFPPDFTGEGLTLDHVIPRSRGGSNRPDNLVTACLRCNSSKAASGRIPQFVKFGWFDSITEEGVKLGRRKIMARIRRQLKKPLNRELGRYLLVLVRSKKPATVGILTLPMYRELMHTTPPNAQGLCHHLLPP